jgi:hypothetical protein
MSYVRFKDGRGHRGRTPAWYRNVIAIDVFTLTVIGVGWLLLRRSEPAWPVALLLIMLPIATHLVGTVYLAIRDARRASSTSDAAAPRR